MDSGRKWNRIENVDATEESIEFSLKIVFEFSQIDPPHSCNILNTVTILLINGYIGQMTSKYDWSCLQFLNICLCSGS